MRSKTLGEICRPKQWKNLRISNLTESGFPVYGANGIIGYYAEFNHEKPTIAITCRGATCGNVHITQERSYITSNAMALDELDTNAVEISFLANYLKFRGLNDITTGAAQPQIIRGNLEKIQIPLPPLDDQKRIAHLLGKVEGLISGRKQHLQQLNDLLKSVFLEMFGDPVWNEKGWEIEPLAKLIAHQPNNGLYKPQSSYGSGTRIIRIDSFYDGYVQGIENLKRVEISNAEYENYCVETDDILINRVNSIEYLGKLGVVPEIDEPMVYESNMMRFRLDKQAILPIFLMFVWRLPFIKSQIVNRAKKAVNQASINQKDVRSFLVPKPPIPLQNQFAAIVEEVEGLKSRYQQSLTDLEALYGALSQKAFKGELDLSRLPKPTEGPDIAEEAKFEAEDKQPMEPLFELPAPADLAMLQSAEGRKTLIGQWLAAWLEQLGDAPFAAQPFMEAVRQRLCELSENEAPDWGAAEYDELKAWVFEALEQGRLTQSYDDANNRVQITAAKG